jgi:hypothetical protein
VGNQKVEIMRRQTEIQQGPLALMVQKTLDVPGPRCGHLLAELKSWHQTADIIARFLAINMEAPR